MADHRVILGESRVEITQDLSRNTARAVVVTDLLSESPSALSTAKTSAKALVGTSIDGIPLMRVSQRFVRGDAEDGCGAVVETTLDYGNDESGSHSIKFTSGTITYACGTDVTLASGVASLSPTSILTTDSIARFTPEMGVIPSGYTIRGSAVIDNSVPTYTRDFLTGHSQITLVSENGTTYSGGGFAIGTKNGNELRLTFTFINPVIT